MCMFYDALLHRRNRVVTEKLADTNKTFIKYRTLWPF